MKNSETLLTQLLSAARDAGAFEESHPPLGFATRVAAQWAAQRPTLSLWVRLSLASLPCGGLAAAVCLYVSSQAPATSPDDGSRLAQWIVQSELAP